MKRKCIRSFCLRILIYIFTLTILIMMSGCGSGNSSQNAGHSEPRYSGSVSLSWYAPAYNEDGSPLTDLGGYKIYYGTTSQDYTSQVNVGLLTSCTISNLPEGMYYFALVAYDKSGNESGYSTEISRYIEEGEG